MAAVGEYDVCVVGAGMMGSAAARHILELETSLNVILIGPEEKQNKSDMTIHGAYYDEARITRIVDTDKIHAILNKRSAQRFRDIEKQSGIHFYDELGYLGIGPSNGEFIRQYIKSAVDLEEDVTVLGYNDLSKYFPYFRFQQGYEAVFSSKNCGIINPRRLVEAEKILASRQGATIVDDVVSSISEGQSGYRIETEAGRKFLARKVLLATGAFTNCRKLLPSGIKPEMRLLPEAVILVEINEEVEEQLRNMPSITVRQEDGPQGSHSLECYILPPVKYPDGKSYLKIGHGRGLPMELQSSSDIYEWYSRKHKHQNGILEETVYKLMRKYFPDIPLHKYHYDYCVTAHTTHGHTYIDMLNQTLGVALGGNGRSAKSADELGLIAARMIVNGSWNYDIPMDYFKFVASESSARTKVSKL